MGNFIMSNKVFYHIDRIDCWLKNKPVKPITVKLYITNRCNLNCYYCIYKDRISNDEMRFKDSEIILKKLKEMEVKGIVFTGGEPTFHKDYKKIVEIASKDFEIGFITNGVIYPDILKNLKWIRFSLDSSDSEIYKKIKGIDKSGEVINNIIKAIEEKKENNLDITIGIQMVVTPENYDYIKDNIYFADNLGADYFQFRPLENYDYKKEEWAKIWRMIEASKYMDLKIKIIPTLYKWKALWENKRVVNCRILNFIGSISVKGDFYPCCFLIGKNFSKCGNLIKNNIEDILHKRQEIIENIDYSKCPVLCQGTATNEVLEEFYNLKHINFI